LGEGLVKQFSHLLSSTFVYQSTKIPYMGFIYTVITVFLIFATKYFVVHSLSSKLQSSKTLQSAILCIYYLPVFLLSLYLFYAGVTNFFSFAARFLHFYELSFYNLNNLFAIGYFFTNALLVSFLFWLAKKSGNKAFNFYAILYKLLYIICSIVILNATLNNFELLFQLDFTNKRFDDRNNLFVLSCTIIFVFILLFVPHFRRSNFALIVYARLAAKIMLRYFSICFLLAAIGVFFKFFFKILESVIP
jgi:hypothetical protein